MAATTDTTIREVRTTLLRLPWPDDPWLAHHPLGPTRDLVVVEVETQSGITGMGYLHLLHLPLLRTIGACLEEAMAPRVVGRDATEVEAIWFDLWRSTITAGRGGIAMMAHLRARHRAVGRGGQARRAAAAPALGAFPLRHPGLRQRLLPRRAAATG